VTEIYNNKKIKSAAKLMRRGSEKETYKVELGPIWIEGEERDNGGE